MFALRVGAAVGGVGQRLRDEQALLTTGSGVTIPPGTPHSLRNIGDVILEMIAIHTPATR